MVRYEAEFHLGQRAKIDDDLEGKIAAVRFYSREAEYLVAWFCNGDAKSDWFAGWRLKNAE